MAGTGLKAIETVYNGYRFRSRLEARWAVFFDALGVRYEYEPQGFDLDGLWYLPDFWLPEHEYWIEIKPQAPDATAHDKAARLAEASRHLVFMFYGDIPYPHPGGPDTASAQVYGPLSHEDGGDDSGTWWDQDQWWTQCTLCGTVGIHYQGAEDRLPGPCAHKGGPDTPRLQVSYRAARQARFEHSANPAPRLLPPTRPNPG